MGSAAKAQYVGNYSTLGLLFQNNSGPMHCQPFDGHTVVHGT